MSKPRTSSSRCRYDNCLFRASFAAGLSKTPLWCSIHKTEYMRNVKNPVCASLFCKKLASFGTVANRPLFCKVHKSPDMWNVKNKICSFYNCKSPRPAFGTVAIGRQFCGAHYNPRLHWRLSSCNHLKCKAVATHSFSGEPRFSRCPIHALPTDLTFCQTVCTRCQQNSLCHSTGLCFATCYKPDIVSTEKQLHLFFKTHSLTPVYNQKVLGTKYRPDFVFHTPDGVVIVENDEHGHVKYNKTVEQERMQEMQSALKLPTHFVRFNPHSPNVLAPLDKLHLELLAYIQNILVQSKTFFETQTGLTVHYMFY